MSEHWNSTSTAIHIVLLAISRAAAKEKYKDIFVIIKIGKLFWQENLSQDFPSVRVSGKFQFQFQGCTGNLKPPAPMLLLEGSLARHAMSIIAKTGALEEDNEATNHSHNYYTNNIISDIPWGYMDIYTIL